ncbi:hypothetical protein ACIQMJ_21545 [Actinosynnema sp. NPDC091369]
MFLSTQEGSPLHPVLTSTVVKRNRTGDGGDSGTPGIGGFEGWAGTGGGGVYTLKGQVTSTNGSYVLANRPDNCSPVEYVQGCVNTRTAPRAHSPWDAAAVDRRAEELAMALRAASALSR